MAVTKTRGRRSKKQKPLWLYLAVALLSLVAWVATELPKTTTPVYNANGTDIALMEIIDVGQGASALLRVNGEEQQPIILIDTGESSASNQVFSTLKSYGVEEIELFILTHLHTDHYGGAVEVLENFKVKELLMPETPYDLIPTNSKYSALLTAIEENGCDVSLVDEPMEIDFSQSVSLAVLDAFVEEPKGLNDTSLVIKITAGDTSFLITGDGEKAVENALLDKNQNVKSTIFIAGHHGSNTSNTQKFLNAVSPRATIIQVGRDNQYNLPNENALERISAFGNVYRTDLMGNIVLTTDGNAIKISSQAGEDII